ncbi:Spastin [Phytophthora nicotianae]|uniref:microtubule-severing ATPase n=1 Tax=Phytophthora nicotianae TaxID=4792 RepID=A0A0W8BCR2_PHYNI|nr:Spastin [Phytophthora nicotianae]
MFLWRARRPEDAIQKIIEEAVAADKAGKYAEAVELYASGIEKMMAQMAQLPNEEAQTHMRQKINEYMLRAEHIKEWMAEQARKQQTQEAVILPTLRPDLFTGLRAPPRGVLLFGPPGTGNDISASSLTSKWVGEGEKLVRALFEMARELQPSVVFMDEIDALLSTRSASENDASRRIKNQFFTELDGAASSQEDRILVMGATNLPQELDEAIVRRLEKRIYVPLPDASSREGLIRHLLSSQKFSMSSRDFKQIVKATEGYSGSDLKAVCKDAALGPIRELGARVANVKAEDVRGINASDFQVALTRVRPSVSSRTIQDLVAWNEQYGVSAV